MRGWLLTATLAIVVAGAAVGLLALRRLRPASVPQDTARCQPETPLDALPPATAGLTLSTPPGVAVRVDGQPVGASVRLPAGRHWLEADPGVRLELALAPFSPASVELWVDGPALLPLVLGASCTSCEVAPGGDLELTAEPGLASLEASARALGVGAWRAAQAQLRAVPDHQRGTPRVQRQLASLWSLVGRPSRARGLAGALARLEVKRRDEEPAERDWQLARWNLATERLNRLLTAFALDAERLVSVASVRTEQLSVAFTAAAERRDLPGSAVALEAEEATLEALRLDLLALRTSDCAWRARVQRTVLGPLSQSSR